MDKFIVSARKYRPQTFDTVVGQEHITTTLKNAIKNNQLAHAFLFCGPRGVGKTTCARILAKTINCEARTADTEACNECSSCRSFNSGSSLNIHELDAASNSSVDDIRNLTDQVRFAPQAGRYKVYIIDEVHMLSASAFNAFLKTLEEPPPYAIFILATTEKHKILPTILSRCQIFDFKRITTQDTVDHLQKICTNESIRAEKTALQLIAQKSEGCMRDALSIMDKIISFTSGELSYTQTLDHLNILDEDYYFKLLEYIMAQDLSAALLLYNDINSKGFEGDLLLDGMAEFIRNLLVSKDSKALVLLDVMESFRERYAETALKTDLPFLISALNVLNEAEINYKSARNKRLHVELALIKLSYLRQALSLSSEEGVKKKLNEGTAVAFRKIAISPASPKKPSHTDGASLKIDSSLLNHQESQKSREAIDRKPVKPSELSKQKPASQAVNVLPTTQQPESKRAGNEEPGVSGALKGEPSTRIGRLNKIRNSIEIDSSGTENPAQALEIEKLESLWKEFGTQLQNEKNPAYKPFELARLQIEDAGNFTVITNNNLEQKFIEQEKMRLSEFLQTAFCNRNLFFNITVTDTPEMEVDTVLTLNKKQQFLKIAENYPLVKELKDRLKLELDY